MELAFFLVQIFFQCNVTPLLVLSFIHSFSHQFLYCCRFWLYQLWIKLVPTFKDKPVLVPHFLEDYKLSFVYSEDIPQVVLKLLSTGPQIQDQAINLAYPDSYTLIDMIQAIQDALDIPDQSYIVQEPEIESHAYFYPTARRGPVHVEKAVNLLNWTPTPWAEMIKATVAFYEDAISNPTFANQRDEIIQIVGHHVFKDDLLKFYEALEDIYKIELSHFKKVKDEL